MAERQGLPRPACPACGQPMTREIDGLRSPPMPEVFWFCTNGRCEDGKQNKIYYGG